MNSNDVLQQWADRSGEYSPDYYAYYGPDETSDSILDLVDEFAGPDAAVLELGCSSGRHLSHLYEHGYENVSGIEVNPDAFDVMEDTYPDLAAEGTFYADAIENVVDEFDDDGFDVVFSAETLQHIHPNNEWVFSELSRITGDLLVTVENEGSDGEATAESSDGDDDRTDGEQKSDDGPDDPQESVDVNYVRDDVPLYYRDWGRVFDRRGFTQVASESLKRKTLRAFRPE